MTNLVFTDIAIQRLKPGIYYDTNTPAFGIRVGKHRKAWVVMKGKERRRITIGHYPALSLKEARKKAHATLGTDAGPTKAPTFLDALDEFLKLDRWKANSKYQLERNIRRFFTWTKTLDKITHGDVAEVVEAIPKKGQRAHSLKDIKTFFNWCVPRHIPANPAAGIKGPKYVPRKRTLSDEELKKVWLASHDVQKTFGAIVRFIILTGARKTEVATLKWENVNGTITFPETKNGEPRTFPTTDLMKATLEKQARLNSTPYIFPGKEGVPYNGWGKHKAELDEKTNIDHTLHDLRRTFAHNWQKLGAPVEVTEAALGHVGTRGGIVGIYQTYSYSEEIARYYSLWDRKLATLIAA